MIESHVGDIWDLHPRMWVVIPTNIGWNHRLDCVMGRGLAKQAADRCSGLARILGTHYSLNHRVASLGAVKLLPVVHLIALATKPLALDEAGKAAPSYSWRQRSDLALIERGCADIANLAANDRNIQIAVPLLGCGNGGLSEGDVLPIMRKHLDHHFTLVRLPYRQP